MLKKYNSSYFANPYQKVLNQLTTRCVLKKDWLQSVSDGLLCADEEEEYQLLKLMGAPLVEHGAYVMLQTSLNTLQEQKFCFVDIETNGSHLNKHQIIEIGALLYQGGKILDRFESLVFCDSIPRSISEITHITLDDLVDAPPLGEVLEKFKAFLGDSVFVAHNVEFDFNFLNAMLCRHSMGWLCNRCLCTIKLARKTIISTHYNLAHLNDILDIGTPVLHRAYSDALTACEIFKYSLRHIPSHIISTEDLIAFSLLG